MNDGGPAFPVPETSLESAGVFPASHQGMYLRAWFARTGAEIHAECVLAAGFQPSSVWPEIAAEGVRFADAMIAALARKEDA